MPKHASSDNGVIDKRPAAVTRRVDVADGITAVNVAHGNRLLLAMRGGGHNGPGTFVLWCRSARQGQPMNEAGP